MNFQNVVLESIQLSLPEEIWSSEAIEKRLQEVYNRFKVSVGRLELMTGIRERRVWPESFQPSEEAAKVGNRVLDHSKVDRDSIELLIHGGVCRDRLEPATAAYVHRQCGLPAHTQFMDVSNACLGFVNGLISAAAMIEAGLIKSAMIVTAETSRWLIDNTIESVLHTKIDRKKLKQYFANLTIGSGAVAAVLCHAQMSPDSPAFKYAVAGSDSSQNHLCEGGDQGHEMLTDSEALMKAGVQLAKNTWQSFEKESGWTADSVDHFVCHQVGKMHQKFLYDSLGLDLSKDFSTYPTLGNMGSAALPGTLAQALETESIQRGDRVALLGIGSGISSVMIGMEA